MATVRIKFSGRTAKADAIHLAELTKGVAPLASREISRCADRYGLAGELGADEVEVLMGLDLPPRFRTMVEEWNETVQGTLAWEAARPRAFEQVQRRMRERIEGRGAVDG